MLEVSEPPLRYEYDFDLERASVRRAIDNLLDARLAVPADARAPLFEAMRHASIGGGKRMRPLLVTAAASLFDVPHEFALRAGLAVECIHAHSLVHDDLPCMDNDDLRHGKPTVHRAYGEAQAVLAGDSLLAMAFEILAEPATHPDAQIRAQLVGTLAHAAGPAGIAGGQIIDILAPRLNLDLAGIARLQRLKTGALIVWCVGAGAILGHATVEAKQRLEGYAQCLGLAFQISDDLLDVDGDEAKAGKRLRKDKAAGKETFVSLLGAGRARAEARSLVAQACEHLAPFGRDADPLRAIAAYAISRDH